MQAIAILTAADPVVARRDYFANPESKYFGLGKIKEDQVIDYAKRRGISTEIATKWLSPNIAD